MPRARAEISEQRRVAIMRDVLADEKPIKAIAADHDISVSWARNVLWNLGYRSMVVSSTERKFIKTCRARDPHPLFT